MRKLLRRLLPLAGALAWRNRSQISNWYRNRNDSDDKSDEANPAPSDDNDSSTTA